VEQKAETLRELGDTICSMLFKIDHCTSSDPERERDLNVTPFLFSTRSWVKDHTYAKSVIINNEMINTLVSPKSIISYVDMSISQAANNLLPSVRFQQHAEISLGNAKRGSMDDIFSLTIRTSKKVCTDLSITKVIDHESRLSWQCYPKAIPSHAFHIQDAAIETPEIKERNPHYPTLRSSTLHINSVH
jgi:hypothetical protein